LNEALLGPAGSCGPFATHRRTHARAFAQLVIRARDAGCIRPELTIDDVRAGLIAITAIGAVPRTSTNTTISRLANLIVAGVGEGPPRRSGAG
jgi:hypothetical protein